VIEKPRGLPQKRSTTFFRIPLQVDCSFCLGEKRQLRMACQRHKRRKTSRNHAEMRGVDDGTTNFLLEVQENLWSRNFLLLPVVRENESKQENIARWCNGSTQNFGFCCPRSNRGWATLAETHFAGWWPLTTVSREID
jgi:hypothetical protein